MDESYRFVKPKTGVIVRFPRSYGILPEAGGNVPWIGADGRYWRRRANTGDVEIILQQEQEEVKEIRSQRISNFKRKNGEEE